MNKVLPVTIWSVQVAELELALVQPPVRILLKESLRPRSTESCEDFLTEFYDFQLTEEIGE